MGPYFNEKLSDEIKPGIKTGVNTGIGLNLSDHVVLGYLLLDRKITMYQREHGHGK